ncbi:hypothetical protein [Bacterioplanoides sp.]|uniref:hypothetical protein n=1 Tax=Bacterioplanoides sp. TaxID=2066072 RepID=UPI003AFFCB09
MSEYQIATIRQIWIVLPFLLFVSGAYWHSSRSLIKSAHGILILLAFSYAVWVSELTEFGPPFKYYAPMYVLLIAGLASMTFSFKAFIGKKRVHLVHGLTLLSAFLVWFVGSMAIAHDWI